MSMAQKNIFDNVAGDSGAAKLPAVNLAAARAAIFAALAKIGGKESDRDALAGGDEFAARVEIRATLASGHEYRETFDTETSVGHDSQRAVSHGITSGELLAYVLGKMNATTRDAVLRDLAAEYAANGHELPVDKAATKAAEEALKRLRATEKQTVRGSVSVSYERVEGDGKFGIVGLVG